MLTVGTRTRLAALFIPVLGSPTAAGGPKPAAGAGLTRTFAAVPHHFTVQNNQQREFLRFAN